MKIYVSGTTYYGACDPRATGVPVEEDWPKPESMRVGKGQRFVYEGDGDLAVKIASHLECLAEGFSYSDDLDAKAEGRAFARDARRIREQLRSEA